MYVVEESRLPTVQFLTKGCIMPASNQPNSRLKAAVSVSGMAKLVGLSRARFYDLIQAGIFVAPVYSLANRRPFYTQEMQEENLLARQTGIGVNGQYTLFYERQASPPASSISAPRRPVRQDHGGIIESLKSLGLPNVTLLQVDEAMATNYPNGTAGVDEMMVVRTIYRHLRRLGVAG
jgi:hypothetical protein